ncbi:MAG: hypothetical protein LBB18_01090 [Puniceicoccales bacterium]|nr:hypothetical protein [Puniceicoccales bacterium]
MTAQLAMEIASIHANEYVHCDVKPENSLNQASSTAGTAPCKTTAPVVPHLSKIHHPS